MDAEYTGKRILSLRKEKGWTQKDLAQQLHVTDKAISKWERGINFPDLSLFETLADVLETSVSDLLGIENSSTEKLLEAVTRISEEEKDTLKREFRNRIWLSIIIEVFIFISQICVSKILADHQLYGSPQILTAGMAGFTGLLIGNGIYLLKKYKKLQNS